MSDPEFGLTDYDVLKETLESIGCPFTEEASTVRNGNDVVLYEQRSIVLVHCKDSDTSFHFTTEGKFRETELFTTW